MSRRTGIAWHTAIHTAAFGWQEMFCGDLDEAERLSLEGIHQLRELGEQTWLSYALVLLADVRIAQGRFHEALALADEGEAIGRDDLKTVVHAATIRARAHARLGAVEDARQAATSAVDLAETTDSLLVRVFAQEALATALAAAGESKAALAAAQESGRLARSLGYDQFARRVGVVTVEIERSLGAAEAPTPLA
jgi:ATP/maltotriose-dependent transcriptional regulator MalT